MINPFSDQPQPTLPDGSDIPVWRGTATSKMKIDIAVNPEGKVLVLHDQPFPDYLEWVEFDALTGEMTFITAEGKLQDLGMLIHAPMNKHVARAQQVCTIRLHEGEVRDMGLVTLIVRNKNEGMTK